MDEAMTEAARIMRDHKPKTIGDMFGIARGRAVNQENALGAFLDDDSDENGHAWSVVDAHCANLSNPEYCAAAGITCKQTTEAQQ